MAGDDCYECYAARATVCKHTPSGSAYNADGSQKFPVDADGYATGECLDSCLQGELLNIGTGECYSAMATAYHYETGEGLTMYISDFLFEACVTTSQCEAASAVFPTCAQTGCLEVCYEHTDEQPWVNVLRERDVVSCLPAACK